MSEPIKPVGSTHHKAHQGEHHAKRKHHVKRPCPCPPATPTSIALTYKAHRQDAHLRFYAKVKWGVVTADQCGHPLPGGGVKLDHYEIELQPTDIAGVPAQTEDTVQGQAVPHMKRKMKKVPGGVSITAATAAASIATFTLKAADMTSLTMAVNDIVKVTGVQPGAYNGDWKVLSVTTTTFTANIGATPGPGHTFGLVEGAPDPSMNIIFTSIPNPKKWYWRARVRVWDDNQCSSYWSPWTSPSLPYSGSTTQPPAPTGVVLTFDKIHRMRNAQLSAVVTWNEVINWDTGLDKESDMGGYQIELDKSDDGATWPGQPRSKHRSAKPKIDTDHHANADVGPSFDGNADTLDVRFLQIHRKYFYRARVRAISRHHIKGPWSAWQPSSSGTSPSDTSVPPVPANVDLKIHQHRARVFWDHPDESAQTWSYTPGASDAAKTEIVHDDVAFFQVQLDNSTSWAGGQFQKDMFVGGQHRMFRIVRPVANGPNWFARVRSVSATHRVSAWVTVSNVTLVALPTPSAPSVAFDQSGPRHNRARVIVTVNAYSGGQQTAHDDDFSSYTVQVAYAATHPGATPPAGANRHHQRVHAEEAGDDLTATFHSVRKDHYVYARVKGRDKEGKVSAWSSWTDAGQPTAGTPPAPTGVTDVSTHKLIGIRWDTPMEADDIRPNEDISHYHVQVGTTSAFSVIEENAKHVIHRQLRWRPPTFGVAHFMRVRSVDALGGVSAWAPSASGISVTAGDDSDPIGHIKKVHHPVNAPPALTDLVYLHCRGTAVSRTTFAALFAKIGTSAGAGDGATTFNLPDHRGKHAMGVSTHTTAGHKNLGARDDADTTGTKVDHRHDIHPDTDIHIDNADHAVDMTFAASSDPEGAHTHNASNISVGASFGEVIAGNNPANGNAAGPNHGHGLSGFTGLQQVAHPHPVSHSKGGKHPGQGKHQQAPEHGANNSPWIAVHYVIRALA
jgi:microcystin-dependent protein